MPKCIECGFLAARDYESRALVEVDQEFRDTGTPTSRPGSKFHWQERVPICFVQRQDLQEELLGPIASQDPRGSQSRAQMLESISGRMVIELLKRDRPECERHFTPWRQGFTPKEHREMLDRQWRIQHEDEVRKAVWEREDERDREMRTREDTRDGAARGRHRDQVIWFGVIVAAATIVAAIIGVVFGEGDVSVVVR